MLDSPKNERPVFYHISKNEYFLTNFEVFRKVVDTSY